MKLDHISLRFNEHEQLKLAARLDPSRRVRTQLKEMIFDSIRKGASQEGGTDLRMLRIEGLIREQGNVMTGILKLLVERIEELEAELQKVGKDAERAKLVIENIQDYMADEAES